MILSHNHTAYYEESWFKMGPEAGLPEYPLSVWTKSWRLSRVFVHSAYTSPSTLFWKDMAIQSAEGVQQGGPLGPLLFCLTIHSYAATSVLKSELCLFYLDDDKLGSRGKV